MFKHLYLSILGDYQNFSEFSPVGHQPFRQNNDKEVSRNLKSPQYYPHYQAESTPGYLNEISLYHLRWHQVES